MRRTNDLWMWMIATAYCNGSPTRAEMLKRFEALRPPEWAKKLMNGLANNNAGPIKRWLEERGVKLKKGESVAEAVLGAAEQQRTNDVFNEQVAFLRGNTLSREELIGRLKETISTLERDNEPEGITAEGETSGGAVGGRGDKRPDASDANDSGSADG